MTILQCTQKPPAVSTTPTSISAASNCQASCLQVHYFLVAQPPSLHLDDIRVMVIVWRLRVEVKTEYYQNCYVLDCVTQCSPSAAHLYEQSLLEVQQIGFVILVSLCCAQRGCIIVTWWSGSGGIQTWSRWPTSFLHCFDTVALVIWPVKIAPEMTYNVLSGTLSLYTTTTTLGSQRH